MPPVRKITLQVEELTLEKLLVTQIVENRAETESPAKPVPLEPLNRAKLDLPEIKLDLRTHAAIVVDNAFEAMDFDFSRPSLRGLVMTAVSQTAGKGVSLSGIAEVSRGPVLLEPPDLSYYYPYNARRRGISGTTRIRVELDMKGDVVGVIVLESNPPETFDRAALRLGRRLQFKPALKKDGNPVRSTVVIPLRWEIEE